MSYQCTNPWVYGGELGDAPEFESDSPIDCSVCLGTFDADDDSTHEVNGKPICRDCVHTCDLCGEWLDDELVDDLGPAVRYRRWEVDGKLSEPTHAFCAGERLEEMFALFTEDLAKLEAETSTQL